MAVPGTNGAIYVMSQAKNTVKGAAPTWVFATPITVTKDSTALGYSLALSQDAKYLITGAFSFDTAGDSDGAVYAFAPQK